MPEVKKRKILLASVLKPVNDTRMVEKIAQSLAETKQFDIHVIGFPAKVSGNPPFKIHPHPGFNRISAKRLSIPWKFLKQALALKPDLIIITTHELLITAMLAKLFLRCKVIYDVQENYYATILNTSAFPRILRPFLAAYVRLKEIATSAFIDHFFLAEEGYKNELSFAGKKFTVLQNKLKLPESENPAQRNKYQLLFSGTLAETTGVFKAIEIAVKLHEVEPKISLVIIGYAAKENVFNQITHAIAPHSFISLIGGNKLVPHEEIIQYIRSSWAGIVSYPYNASTTSSIPTKLFEYLGYRLPIILVNHPVWVALCEPYHAACVFDPRHIDARYLLNMLNTKSFYDKAPRDVFWESEQPKLIRQVLYLLN